MNILALFDELDSSANKEIILRPVFPYPGGKIKSIRKILPHLPYAESYIEPFGGSAAVLLSRNPSKLEVYNDIHSGLVAFYRCMRNERKMNALIDWLDCTVHSREEFEHCKKHWLSCDNDIEQAGMWYYAVNYSFSSLGRNWGRATTQGAGRIAGKIRNKLKRFPLIHQRFKNVQVEHCDWQQCLQDYDSPNAVFYLDPTYVDAHKGTFQHELDIKAHQHLLEIIFHLKGFIAVSGYSNPLYDNQDWDSVHSWDANVSISPCAYTESNFKKAIKNQDSRTTTTEMLWIKEAK